MRRSIATLRARAVQGIRTLVRRRGRVPAGTPARREPGSPDSSGGAGVREPRRPSPPPPALSAAESEPGRLQLLDLTER